ncbi:carboxypeptidase inhibitor SmCI-like [Physella acuta]|uniref:carboxypeptidase inhibitor SmCI-like n=1 Tax=Physella acuta TaxID=109671 RepID=UPI0027DDD7E4|nr:carboxypeptidase inhibitor SmCI-like [Physella acuta]
MLRGAISHNCSKMWTKWICVLLVVLNLQPSVLGVPKYCKLEPDPGPCEAAMPMFYYNPSTNACEEFIYGGCWGNRNRFETKKTCVYTCAKYCLLDPEPGQCEALAPRFYYNPSTNDCEEFNYGGCGGNKNRFETKENCVDSCGCAAANYKITLRRSANTRNNFCKMLSKAVCVLLIAFIIQLSAGDRPSDCQLQPNKGRCYGYFLRYYFNPSSGRCDTFIFGGCLGNKNNFITRKKCMETCGRN